MDRRLHFPKGMVDVVLDTDTYNEVDDQFALAYMLCSGDKLNVKGISAAPFHNSRSCGPGDGMEKSFQEIHRILELMGREDMKEAVYRGADRFLDAGDGGRDSNASSVHPAESAAARYLIGLSCSYSADNPLYVISIAAATNVASALLMDPSIRERIVVVWLGGNGLHWPHNREFNLEQDVTAARVVLGSGVPVILLPCQGVVSGFSLTRPELEYWLKGRNPLCDYLVETVCSYMEGKDCLPTWSKTIWDVTAVAWLVDGRFMDSRMEHCPLPGNDGRWMEKRCAHEIRYVYHINRDVLFYDLFKKLSAGQGTSDVVHD